MRSIQSKLLVSFIVMTFIPIIIMGSFSYRISSEALNNKLINAVLNSLELVAKNLDDEIGRIEKNLDFFTVSKELQVILNKFSIPSSQGTLWKLSADLEKYFPACFYREKEIASAYLFIDSRIVYAYKNSYMVDPDLWINQPWFKKTEELDGVINLIGFIPNPDQFKNTMQQYEVSENEERIINMTWPLPDVDKYRLFANSYTAGEANDDSIRLIEVPQIPDKNRDVEYVFAAGRVIRDTQDMQDFHKQGMIFILYNDSFIADIYSNADVEQLGSIIITDQNGFIISHSNKKMLSADAKSLYPFMGEVMKEKYGYIKSSVDGNNAIVAYYTAPATGYKVIEVIPYAKFAKEVYDIGYLTLFLSIACLTILIVVSIFISRSIASPIQDLQVAMKKVENGDFDIQVAARAKDEIGQMTGSFNYMVKRIKELFHRTIEEEHMKKMIEIKSLQYQINPHFLYNILGSIRLIAMMEGSQKASHMLQSLSRLLSRTIGKTGMIISIATEIENIKDFIYIQQICHSEKIRVVYEIDEGILACKIPNLLLQPLVENAIFHGIDKKNDCPEIIITGQRLNNYITFTISDNGIGMTEEQIEKALSSQDAYKKDTFTKIGIKNIDERIKLSFGIEYGIKIESRPGCGTRVIVTIPAIEEECELASG